MKIFLYNIYIKVCEFLLATFLYNYIKDHNEWGIFRDGKAREDIQRLEIQLNDLNEQLYNYPAGNICYLMNKLENNDAHDDGEQSK